MSSRLLTPMQRQYQEIKEEHPDAILFFRLGDFYEMFGDDAVEASQILEITLTARHKDTPNPIPMCGVPYHAAENYLAKLTKAGKKVAIAEQVSDPKLPGIVKREVIRIVTPGTTFSDQVLRSKEHQFVVSVGEKNGQFALGVADLSTGDFWVQESENFEQAHSEIRRIGAKELVFPPHLFSQEEFRQMFPVISHQTPHQNSYEHLTSHFGTKNLKGFGLEEKTLCIEVASLLLSFLEETQKGTIAHLKNIRLQAPDDYMPLDPATIRNLELFVDSEGNTDGSLVNTIDETKTAMGGRMLRRALLQPLKNQEKIEERLDAVDELVQNSHTTETLAKNLKEIADLERLIAKISCGRGNPRDFLSLKNSLQKLPELTKCLEGVKSEKLQKLRLILDSTIASNE